MIGDEEGGRSVRSLFINILAMIILLTPSHSVSAQEKVPTPLPESILVGSTDQTLKTPGGDNIGLVELVLPDTPPVLYSLGNELEAKRSTMQDSLAEGRVPEVRSVDVVSYSLPDDKFELMAEAGIARADFPHVDYVIQKESSWKPFIWNSQGSQAFGLPQRMMSAWPLEDGDDYMTNPVRQLEWANDYANKSYGSWANAKKFWEVNRYW